MTNSQVSWWSVHECVSQLLDRVGEWPLIGTPEWCALPNNDPAKLAAIYSAAEHWALRLETCQQAKADASKDIAQAADWAAIGCDIARREGFYRERPWLRRKKAAS